MTMQSASLLPALRTLPSDQPAEKKPFRDIITDIVNMDSAMYAAEFASTVSAGLWFIFEDKSVMGVNVPGTGINVDDNLTRAFDTRWPDLAADRTLHEQWQVLRDSGEGAGENEWFFNGMKGQLAEFEAQAQLEALGYTNVRLASAANQEGWDVSAIDANGQDVLIQVKTGTSYSAGDIQVLMEDNPEYLFALGAEIHEKVVDSGVETADRLVAVLSPNYERVTGIRDGLDTLTANLGIDIPDGVVDIVPYAGAILAGARLVYSVLRTEREFKAADRTTRNKIQVVQALTIMSRMGVTTTLATVGGMAGGVAGTAVPGVGNLVGGIGGTVAGAGIGMYLNRHLEPHMLDLALGITGLTHDDMFYFKNKPRIDDLALNFRSTAGELAAAPAH